MKVHMRKVYNGVLWAALCGPKESKVNFLQRTDKWKKVTCKKCLNRK